MALETDSRWVFLKEYSSHFLIDHSSILLNNYFQNESNSVGRIYFLSTMHLIYIYVQKYSFWWSILVHSVSSKELLCQCIECMRWEPLLRELQMASSIFHCSESGLDEEMGLCLEQMSMLD